MSADDAYRQEGNARLTQPIEWTDVADGWSVFTGTWNVVRGTADYAGLSGGGRGAGMKLPNNLKSQFEGSLAPS